MRSGGIAGLNQKNKQQQKSSNLVVSDHTHTTNQNKNSRDGSREILSVRTKNNMASRAQSKTSVYGNNNAVITTTSEERGKPNKHKFIKFDNESLKDAIHSIQERLKLNQNLSTT